MTLSMTLSSQVLLLGDFSTALVFLAPPLGPWARESQLQVPVPHPEAPQLWPALTDCAMETDELSVLQEPQISRAEKRRRWGGGTSGVQGPLPLEALQVRGRRSHTCNHAHPSYTMAAWGGCAEEVPYFLLLSVSFVGFCGARARGPDSRGGGKRSRFSGGLKGQRR